MPDKKPTELTGVTVTAKRKQKPIKYVDSKNDADYRAYNDSLQTYNNYLKQVNTVKTINKDYNTKSTTLNSKYNKLHQAKTTKFNKLIQQGLSDKEINIQMQPYDEAIRRNNVSTDSLKVNTFDKTLPHIDLTNDYSAGDKHYNPLNNKQLSQQTTKYFILNSDGETYAIERKKKPIVKVIVKGTPEYNNAIKQQQLVNEGYDITVDGIWGKNSKKAQEDYNNKTKINIKEVESSPVEEENVIPVKEPKTNNEDNIKPYTGKYHTVSFGNSTGSYKIPEADYNAMLEASKTSNGMSDIKQMYKYVNTYQYNPNKAWNNDSTNNGVVNKITRTTTKAQSFPSSTGEEAKVKPITLDDIIKQYPAVKNIGNIQIIPDSNFNAAKYGYGDIEYFNGEHLTNHYGEYSYDNPAGTNQAVVYNPTNMTINNSNQAITLDIISHGMHKDKNYNTLYNNFITQFKKTKYYEDIKRNWAEYNNETEGDNDGKDKFEQNEFDGIIRNLLFEGTTKDFKTNKYWTDAKTEYLSDVNVATSYKELLSYLKTNKLPKK